MDDCILLWLDADTQTTTELSIQSLISKAFHIRSTLSIYLSRVPQSDSQMLVLPNTMLVSVGIRAERTPGHS